MDEADALETDLVDLTGVQLSDLASNPDTVFSHAIRRMLSTIENPHEIVSAFNNSLLPDESD